MEFKRTTRRMQEINLTPLIDVVFHLMVFVMLTTSFVVAESMELSLPSGKSKSASNAHVMRIQLQRDGGLIVDNRTMNAGQLNSWLASRLGDEPNTKIAIFTTTGVSVQQLVNVMDMVYLTGGRNVQVDKVE